MRVLVLYESLWGNTAAVAGAIAAGLAAPPGAAQVVLVDVADDPPRDAAGFDLVVVGGPTHAFSMTRQSTRDDAVAKGAPDGPHGRGIREWLAGLDERDVNRAVATFDTRVLSVRRIPGSAARAAARAVRRAGVGTVVDTVSFYVTDLDGPLVHGELDRAREWGRSLSDRMALAR